VCDHEGVSEGKEELIKVFLVASFTKALES
jgi:hypothetical protein